MFFVSLALDFSVLSNFIVSEAVAFTSPPNHSHTAFTINWSTRIRQLAASIEKRKKLRVFCVNRITCKAIHTRSKVSVCYEDHVYS
jgi:hypothetical protein